MTNETRTPAYYAIIPAHIRYSQSLSANEKLLYGEITALCGKEGYCWASNRYFANLYDCIPETVSVWISHLFQQGFIRTEYRVEPTEELASSKEKKFRTRRYIWIIHNVDIKGGLMKNHKGGLMKNHKHNIIKNIISSSKEEEGGAVAPPLHNDEKFKRTTFSKNEGILPSKGKESSSNIPQSSPTQEYIDHWNTLSGVIRHANPNTITHKSCVRILKQLEAGTFTSKHSKLSAFISSNHLPLRFDGKQWTREEILNTIDRLHKWCVLNKRRIGLKDLLYNPHHPTGLVSLFLVVASDERWKAIRRGKEEVEDPDPVRTEKFCKLIGVNGDLRKRQEVVQHLQTLKEFRLSLPPEDRQVFAYGLDYHCPRTAPEKFLDHFERWLEGQKDWLKNPSPGVLMLRGRVVRMYLDEKWGKGSTGYKGKSVVEFLST